jgi:hypothetical protein
VKIEISRQILKKIQKEKYHEKSPVGAKLFHVNGQTDTKTDGRTDGQTDRHDESNRLFRNFSNARKISTTVLQSLGHNIHKDLNRQ